MSSVLRIIDANANRAREALRVMEDAARFLLDHSPLCQGLKSLRHDLAAALAPLAGLELHRDTPGDVGTTISTPLEHSRETPADVALAAGKRLSEALRAMEEFAKTLGPGSFAASSAKSDEAPPPPGSGPALAQRLEQIRYRGYDLEQKLLAALAGGRARQWRLCVLLTQRLCPGNDYLAVARAALAGGADCLQLREKELEGGELLQRALLLAQLCREHRASLIINDRPDIALLASAAGVHLGQSDLPCAQARKLAGGQLVLGVSTSCLVEAQAAHLAGADYCGVGPMFPTSTKHKEVIVGPDYLRRYLAWDKLPHLAIGGIHAGNLPQLIAAGVRGIAVSSAICAAADPQAATAELVRLLRGSAVPTAKN